MCDVKKYSRMFQDIKQLQPEDTLQLVLEAETEEEQEFFEMVGNFLLQRKQNILFINQRGIAHENRSFVRSTW